MNDQSMPEMSSSSKDQEMLDANEDGGAQSFDRNSLARCGIRIKKNEAERNQRFNESINKEPSTMLKGSQAILNKQNAKDDLKEKEKYNKDQSKFAKNVPSVSSLKVPAEGTSSSRKSQKLKKGKVTFADTQASPGSGPGMNSSKEDEGVSSSNFKVSYYKYNTIFDHFYYLKLIHFPEKRDNLRYLKNRNYYALVLKLCQMHQSEIFKQLHNWS